MRPIVRSGTPGVERRCKSSSSARGTSASTEFSIGISKLAGSTPAMRVGFPSSEIILPMIPGSPP